MVTFYHDTEQDFGIKVDADECRKVVAEFLLLEKQYGITATYNVVGRIYEEQPELIARIMDGGHEVAFHSYHHTYEPSHYQDEIALCRRLSSTIDGYRSPRSQWNESTLRALWQNGYVWSAENDCVPEPYFVHKELIRLPIAGDDWPVHLNQMSGEQWVGSFSTLMSQRRYFGFGNHDFVVSLKPEVGLKAYENLIQVALQKNALIVNFSEAADMFKRAALARADRRTAVGSQQSTRTSHRTISLGEFKFEFRNYQRDAYVKSFGRYIPGPVRKIARKLPYFKSL